MSEPIRKRSLSPPHGRCGRLACCGLLLMAALTAGGACHANQVAPDGPPVAEGSPEPGGGPTVGPNGPAATVRIEAEDYSATSAPLSVTDSHDPQAGGKVIAATAADTRVTYTVVVASAGTYALGLRISTPDQNATLALTVGGAALGRGPPIGSTGADSVFITYVVRNVVLTQGSQTITLEMGADGLLVDWIDVMAAEPPAVAVPAKVFWSNMNHAAIADNLSQWPFVAAHLDGIEWGTGDLTQLAAVGAALNANAEIAVSSGGLGSFSGAAPADWADTLATGILQAIATVQSGAQVTVTRVHINQDPTAALQSLAQATPGNGNAQVGNTFTAAVAAVANAVHAAHPGVQTGMFLGTPVATTWKYMPAFSGAGVSFSVTSGSTQVPFFFDTYPILSGYYAATGAATGGYITDSPAEYFDAGGAPYQSKLLAYERWLHGVGKTHTLITDRYNCTSTDDAGADACYYQAIANYLHTWQGHGGRADVYMIFQLHNGPVDTVPETTANTFANTVMDSIKYIKGVGEQLDLALQGNTSAAVGGGIYQTVPDANQTVAVTMAPGTQQNFTLSLHNAGDVAAMPVLRVAVQGDGTNLVPTLVAGGADVTYAALRDAGWVVTNLVAAGAVADVTLSVAVPADAAAGRTTLTLQGLWNPQDPTAAVRDAVALQVTVGS